MLSHIVSYITRTLHSECAHGLTNLDHPCAVLPLVRMESDKTASLVTSSAESEMLNAVNL